VPLEEARRIRACLHLPASALSAIDPCIGDGAASWAITRETCRRRHGVELDAHRAEQAAGVVARRLASGSSNTMARIAEESMITNEGRDSVFVIAENLIWSARVECWAARRPASDRENPSHQAALIASFGNSRGPSGLARLLSQPR
jgi:hypothetical protein